ncbi:class I SAM-dependent methyltransferase [Haliangium ochraceum]|uniref:Methyltransferase type 11 n=1 Tax=Haliangium ochraceum (strain DSM 14365 / JCM 11303 / SMP-2) TaxID=502025 RepID=D0LQG3_HALO1|nr:class I SAM-dependent methyltransferase [Haliangium ochraceum]ACY18972.1 Methyltransferase type 11 [Haliangium ochraceum DSM 14365]
MSSDRFKDHFSATADGYAAHRPTYPVQLVEYLAQLTGEGGRPLTRAWDCGCGSGQLSRLLAERFESVIATDASAAQIERAAAHPRIDYRCARAEASALAPASADLIVVAQAAHWFDLERFYAEVRRVAAPNAALALVSYGLMQISAEIDDRVGHFYREVIGVYWPPERRLVDEGYRSLPFPFDEREAPALAIEHTWTLAGLLGYVATWSALGAMGEAARDAALREFAAQLGEVWGEPERARTLTWPLRMRAGLVR